MWVCSRAALTSPVVGEGGEKTLYEEESSLVLPGGGHCGKKKKKEKLGHCPPERGLRQGGKSEIRNRLNFLGKGATD